MIKSTLDPACTGLFSSLFIDYIQKKESVEPFYQEFPETGNFKPVIAQKTLDQQKRDTLVAVLKKQYKGLDGAKVDENINKLNQSNTFTVTTGHQLNLMTGPAYFIYKIVSTIVLAEKLKNENPNYEFVPVYWMASEDHDFEEINHFFFDGKNYQWDTDQKGPVGEFIIDGSLKALIKDLHFLPDFFKEAYTGSKLLKEAVRKYVHHLFADRGLVILDANEKELKQLFLPVIKDDLFSAAANDLVNVSNSDLEDAGYATQIFPREINFFYMEPGRRERLIRENGIFKTADGENEWSEAEMEAVLEEKPENFSPNVVMRPLYQEAILPNIAYLGGPAEVAYWFQLKRVFKHYAIDFPFLLPRNFAMVLPTKLQRKIKKTGLREEDLFLSVDKLRIAYVKENAEKDLELKDEKNKLLGIFNVMEEESVAMDPTLAHAVRAAHKRSEKILDQVAVKFRKAEERKKATAIRQLYEIKEGLFPNGVLQERKVNFLEFYLGNPDFIQSLFDAFNPLDFHFILLKENGRERKTKKIAQS